MSEEEKLMQAKKIKLMKIALFLGILWGATSLYLLLSIAYKK